MKLLPSDIGTYTQNIQYTSQKMNSWIINKLDSSLRFCRPKPPTSKVARVSTWLLATPKLYSDLNLNTSISIFGQIWVSKCSNFTKAKIATLQILTLRSSKLVKWRKRLYLDYCTTFNIRNTDLPINDDGIRRGFISVTTRFLFAASTERKKRGNHKEMVFFFVCVRRYFTFIIKTTDHH